MKKYTKEEIEELVKKNMSGLPTIEKGTYRSKDGTESPIYTMTTHNSEGRNLKLSMSENGLKEFNKIFEEELRKQ